MVTSCLKRCLLLLLWSVVAGLMMTTALTAAPTAQFRREIKVGSDGKASGRQAVHLVFFLPDSCNGFRLTDAKGRERGVKILNVTGSRREILFNADPDEKLMLGYYRDGIKPQTEEPVSGLVREVYSYGGANVMSVADFNQRRADARREGARLEKKVYSAANPFGENRNSLHAYRGFLRIGEPGEYWFYTASTDASFLLIDGKAIASWPGRHWVGEGLYGKHGGAVKLDKGVHRFEYFQANNNPDVCYSIAAYRRAEKAKFQFIPEAMFTPVLKCEPGVLKNETGNRVADLSWNTTETMNLDGVWCYRLEFLVADGSNGASCHWEIDGTKADGASPVWFVFEERPFKVRLQDAEGSASHLIAPRRRYETGIMPADKEKKLLREMLAQESKYGLSEAGYRFLCAALVRLKMTDEAMAFYQRLPKIAAKLEPETVLTFFRELILDSRLDREMYEDALAELRRFAEKVRKPEARAAALEQAKIQLYCLGKANAAAEACRGIDEKVLPEKELKEYRLLTADLALYNDGLAAAKNQYDRLSGVKRFTEQQKMQLGGVLLSIRNCLVLKKYADALEYLDRLEAQAPEMRLRPDADLLRGRALLHSGKPRRAETLLERVLLLEPDPETAAAATLELADLCRRSGRRLQAVGWLKRTVKEAPQSRQAAAAIRMLDELKEEK